MTVPHVAFGLFWVASLLATIGVVGAVALVIFGQWAYALIWAVLSAINATSALILWQVAHD